MNRLSRSCLATAAAHTTAQRVGAPIDVPSEMTGHLLTAIGQNGIRIKVLEELRKKSSISIATLCATAGVSIKTFERIRRNPDQARSVTIDRLADTLKKLRSGNRMDAADRIVFVELIYGGFLAQVAPFFGVTPDQVRAQNPRAATTADKAWSTVAHARQAAVYLTHTVGGVPQRAIARAIGLTEAAVCKAIQSIEDRRDDPKLDRMIDAAAKAVAGRVA